APGAAQLPRERRDPRSLPRGEDPPHQPPRARPTRSTRIRKPTRRSARRRVKRLRRPGDNSPPVAPRARRPLRERTPYEEAVETVTQRELWIRASVGSSRAPRGAASAWVPRVTRA